MNVLLHITTGIAIATLLTDTKKVQLDAKITEPLKIGISAFIVGIASHGALDYIPHCYPINSKIDVILGLTVIILLTMVTAKKYRLITGLAFIGCIFPDLVDLLPAILNKLIGFNLPILDKLFPWHWHEYSGSIYNDNCEVSNINHLLVLMVVAISCWLRTADLKAIYNLNSKNN